MILAVFLVYLCALAGIGIYCSRFNKDVGDFVLGGRRLGAWVAAFSAQASDFSGWLLIGLPAAAYLQGFSITWTCVGCASGVLFNWTVLAAPMRRMSAEYDALTIPDLLEARFRDTTRLIRIISVITILLFYSHYIGAQFIAAGNVFKVVFGIVNLPLGLPALLDRWGMDYYHLGLLIGAVIILLYTAIGGFMAVCWTDFVQAILMFFAAVALPVISIVKCGGLAGFCSALTQGSEGAHMLAIDQGKSGAGFLFGVAFAGLAWGVGYPGQPHIVSRFMAIRDPRTVAKSTLISMVWSLFVLWGSMFIGLSALAVLGPVLDAGTRDEAMPRLAIEVFPAVIAGLVLSGGIAAMMSTVDSQLIVAVSAVVRDIYQKLLGGHPSGRAAVWLSRLVLVALGIGGLSIAWDPPAVFDKVLDAWGGLAAGLGPAIVLACVWRGANRWGVLAGMVVGVLLTQLWGPLTTALVSLGGAWQGFVDLVNPIELVVCVGANLIVTVVLSLFLGGSAPGMGAATRAEAP